MPTLTIDEVDRHRAGRRDGAAGDSPGRRAICRRCATGKACRRTARAGCAWWRLAGRGHVAGHRRLRVSGERGPSVADAGAAGGRRPQDDAGVPAGALPNLGRDPRLAAEAGVTAVALRERSERRAGRTSCASCAGCACACAATWSARRRSASSGAARSARWLRRSTSRPRPASAAARARPCARPARSRSRTSTGSAVCTRGTRSCR